MKQLKLELSAHKSHIDMLGSRLEQVTADVHSQCNVPNFPSTFKISPSSGIESLLIPPDGNSSRFHVQIKMRSRI
jgi:hypothetical protein